MPPIDLGPAPRPIDLTDAEIDELAQFAAALEEPSEVATLDGYLCGLVVLPVRIAEADWIDPAWPPRITALLRRRLTVLREDITAAGAFDPLVFGFDGHHPPAVSEYEPAARLAPVSQALMPWVAGFRIAIERHGAASPSADDPDVHAVLARLYRHLPPADALERDVVATFDREQPLAGLDDAIDDLVAAVVELADLNAIARYHVQTVRREGPKVGRNDPCPCGSGRKFKACHGANR